MIGNQRAENLRRACDAMEADRQGRMPSDDEILACLRPLYSGDEVAAMGAADDLRTAHLLLCHFGSGQPAVCQECGGDGAGGLHEDDCSQNSSDQSSASAEPLVMKEICPECGHQFACFHNPYINQLRAAPVAAQAQPTMPPLTDAMRAVLRNEHDVYGDEDALYAALCDAASLNHFPGATKMVSAESVSGADQAQPVAEVVGRQRLENESGSAVPRIAALDMNLQPGQLLYTCPTAAQAQPVVNQSTEREAFEFWASDEGEYPTAVERDGNGNYKLAQIQSHWEAWQARAALAQQPSGQSQRQPDGYAYRYRSTFGDGTVIRFNRGEEVNGSLPIDAVPFWYAPPDCAQDREDAQRWRYMRRKLCLTGNGNGTCAMQAINLPVAIPGWPEPGQVAEFCDTAIDAAIANDRAAAKEQT